MFYVFNKSKIYSYLIALCTVVILFVAATTINDMASPSGNLVETSTNIVGENNVNSMKGNILGNTLRSKEETIDGNRIKNNIGNEMENKLNK